MLFEFRPVAGSPLEDYLEGDNEAADRSLAIEDELTTPLDLNQVSRADLMSLPWLNAGAAAAVLRERARLGGFRDFSQLEGLPELSPEETELLQQVSVIGPAPKHPFFGYARLTAAGNWGGDDPLLAKETFGESRARFRSLSGAQGFILARHPSNSSVLSQFTSLGLEFRWPSSRVLFGDYQAEFGTGLVFSSSIGQSGWLRDGICMRPPEAAGLRCAPTASQLGFLRGAAAEINSGGLRGTMFASSRDLAAVLDKGEPAQLSWQSVSADELSVAREGQIREDLGGLSVMASQGLISLGAQGFWARFKPSLSPTATPEVPEPLMGSVLRVGSLSLSLTQQTLSLAAELAASKPGGKAFQSAATLHNGAIAFALFTTHADADFQNPHSRGWDEFGAPFQNTQTVGALIRLALQKHLLTLRAASSQTPFRTATSSLTRASSELEVRWKASLRSISLELRGERRDQETDGDKEPSNPLRIIGGRLDLGIRSALDLRLRTQIRRATDASGNSSVGTLSFVQVAQKWPVWSWLARLTVFHVTDDNAALTVYENQFPGSYPLVSFYGDGSRKMFMLSRRWGHFQAGAKAVRVDQTTRGEYNWDWQFALQGELTW
jgi:hypothetical protein